MPSGEPFSPSSVPASIKARSIIRQGPKIISIKKLAPLSTFVNVLALFSTTGRHCMTQASTSAQCDAGSSPSGPAYQKHISSLANTIKPRVLVPVSGSGNYGEAGNAAFWTFERMPAALANMASTDRQLQRTDIDLGPDRLAFYIDNVLSPAEADALASCAEAILEENGHSRVAPSINTPPGMRVNMAAHWFPTRTNAPHFLGPVFERIKHLVPTTLGGLPLYPGLSEKVAQFKYGDGDQFTRHIDGLFPGQGCNERGDGVDEWVGVQSGMSVLFYLNDGPADGLVGGETRLWSADGSRHFDVTPKKGRALLFRRGSPDAVLHAGLPVTGAVPKYMALINLAYGERKGTRPLF